MVDRILLPDIGNRTVLAWRMEGHDVLVRFTDDKAAEYMLECICGRCHWLVREQIRGPSRWFAVTCHNSGHTGSFPMEGTALPPR